MLRHRFRLGPRFKKKLKKLPISFILILLFIISFFYLIESSLNETILAFATTQARWTATEIINKAVIEKVVPEVNYQELVTPERNINDEIVFMQINMIKINKITSEAILEIQKAMENLQKADFKIPLGQVTGIKVLANLGPKFTLTLLPVGTVEAEIVDDFLESGINQTRHRVYMLVESKVQVIIPLASKEIAIESRIPLADAIIVGRVPSTYLNLNKGELLKRGGELGN